MPGNLLLTVTAAYLYHLLRAKAALCRPKTKVTCKECVMEQHIHTCQAARGLVQPCKPSSKGYTLIV